MLGGYSVSESEPTFDLGTKFLLQADNTITGWSNLSDSFSFEKLMYELIQIQNFNPQRRYRIIRNTGETIEVVYDTSTDTRGRRNLSKISHLMGGI